MSRDFTRHVLYLVSQISNFVRNLYDLEVLSAGLKEFAMPPGKLWHFEKDTSVYLVYGNTRSKYGAIKSVKKPSSGDDSNLKV